MPNTNRRPTTRSPTNQVAYPCAPPFFGRCSTEIAPTHAVGGPPQGSSDRGARRGPRSPVSARCSSVQPPSKQSSPAQTAAVRTGRFAARCHLARAHYVAHPKPYYPALVVFIASGRFSARHKIPFASGPPLPSLGRIRLLPFDDCCGYGLIEHANRSLSFNSIFALDGFRRR